MPFRSKAQKRWMYANKPGMAKRWQAETPSDDALPEHAPKRGKIKKAESFSPSYVSGGFPNAAGPEDWDSVGDSPWKQGEPKAKPEEESKKKEKVSQGDDVFGGDGTRLMPYLRAIHKMGHVKRAAGEAPMFDPGAEAEAETEQELAALPPGTGGPNLSAAEAKALFVDLPKRRLREVQRGLMEDALMRKALGKIGHVKTAEDIKPFEIGPENIELPPPRSFREAWKETGQGLKYWRPTARERLRMLRHHLRGPGTDQFGRRVATSEWAGQLARIVAGPAAKALGAAGALYGTYRLGKHIGAKKRDKKALQEAAAAQDVDPSRFRKEAQDVGTLYDIGSMGPSEREGSNVTFRMPKLKRAAGLDQEYPQVEDGEKGYEDAPVTLQAARQGPWKRAKVASIVHLPRESYEAFLDELGRLRQLMEEG